MTHVDASGKGDKAFYVFGFVSPGRHFPERLLYLVVYDVENLGYSLATLGSFTEEELLSRFGMKFNASKTRSFLTAVSLLKHHKMQFAQAVMPRPIFLLKETEGFEQADKSNAAFVFDWVHAWIKLRYGL